LPSAEKLAMKGQYLEAAQLFEQRASIAEDPADRCRCLDSAARCYESAGELSSAVTCYVKTGSSRAREAAMNVCTRSGHPEYLSNALNQLGKKEEAIRLLVDCSLNLLIDGKAVEAQKFCAEAMQLDSKNGSRLLDGLGNVLVGTVENDPEKINLGIRICQDADYKDSAVAERITLFASKVLSRFDSVCMTSRRLNTGPRACPKCGAPLPNRSLLSEVTKCQYCGSEV
jgi:tetratricopeptide (TPR) repeat protein